MHRNILLASLPFLTATMALGSAASPLGTSSIAWGASLAGESVAQPPDGCGSELACQTHRPSECDTCGGYMMTSREWHPCLHSSRKRPSQFSERFKDSIDRFGDRLERCVDRFPIRIQFSSGDACQSDCADIACDQGAECMRVWDGYDSPSLSSEANPPSKETSTTNQRTHPVLKAGPKPSSSIAPPIPSDTTEPRSNPEAAPSPSDLRHDPFQDEASNGKQLRRFSDSRREGAGAAKVRRRLHGDVEPTTPTVIVSEEVVTKRLLNDSHFALRTASAEVPTVTSAEPLRVANGIRRSLVDTRPGLLIKPEKPNKLEKPLKPEPSSMTGKSSMAEKASVAEKSNMTEKSSMSDAAVEELSFSKPIATKSTLTPSIQQSKLRLVPVPHENE